MRYLMNDNGEFFEFSAHKMPKFKELKNKDYILWGYDAEEPQWNNKLPEYYEWLYNSSSKHRAIINRKVLFITGKGVGLKRAKNLQPQEAAETGAFLFKLNDNDFVKKISLNLTKLGGFCYEVIPNKGKTKIEAHYINFKNIRRNKKEYDSKGYEKAPIYYYTSDWSSRKPEDNPDWTVFNAWDWESFDSSKRYLVVHQDDTETDYPIPEYTAAVPYIASDYEISNFVYNNAKKGLSSGWLVEFFNGEPNEDQKNQIAQYWKSRLHGTDNSGEPILSFNETGIEGTRVSPLSPNGQDDRFVNLNKQIREEIFSGHTVNPIVCGLEGNNGFNNNADENRTAVEDFQLYYVSGRQMTIESHINAMLRFNKLKGEAEIKRLDPIQAQVTEVELSQILTEDERRERAGYEPKSKEQKQTQIKETIIQSERNFKAEQDEQIVKFLSANGIWDEDLEILQGRELFAKDIEDAELQSYNFINRLETSVLSVLKSNPLTTNKELSNLLKISESEVNDIKNKLITEQLLTPEGNVTTKGDKELSTGDLFIVYKYEKRNDVSGESIIETTRNFCKRMVLLSKFKSWTIEDIKAMNNGMGLDVFASRGGWYTIPDTNRHVPFCRHIWKQYLVRRK